MYSLFLRDAFIAGDLFLITFFVGDCVFGFIIISCSKSAIIWMQEPLRSSALRTLMISEDCMTGSNAAFDVSR